MLGVATAIALPPMKLIPRQTAPDYAFPGDPPYGVDTGTLSGVLNCPRGTPTSADSKPVLLVHGTGSTGDESWGFGYVPALAAAGFTPCYITLPNRSMGDMQVSSAYIAYNLHAMSAMAGNSPVAVMGHSQGNPDIQWALHFFPSTQDVTSMFVGLSPDFYGANYDILSGVCSLGKKICAPSLWQQASGSDYYAALNAKGNVEQVPTTLIWSQTDEVVIPAERNAQLGGSVTVPVQDLCPLRITDHLSMLIDSAGFTIATDALNNGGKADLGRIRANGGLASCLQFDAPDMDPTVPKVLEAALNDISKGILLNGIQTTSEPPVMQYAIDANNAP